MRIARLLVLGLSVVTACGDDGIHHLPDAPLALDGGIDAAIDAPPPGVIELAVVRAGTGSGTITSSPAGIACGATCTAAFAQDTVITLTAVPSTGSVFGGWSGACEGATPTCEVTLAHAAAATATFTLATYTVTVAKSGAGTGTVSGGGLACGATCSITVTHGTVLSVTSAPGPLSTFAGWGGACSGTAACALTITANTSITASFVLDDVTLFVSKGGTGSGTVTSSSPGINCGADCQETYTAGQMTTLTATPATGSTFTGWSGAGCTGTGPCTVTMTAATTVTAMFTLDAFALDVTRGGNGSGSVTSLPAGIACGAACSATYDYGTVVTLTPAASLGSMFTGWSGACSGAGACSVTIDAAKSVIATFTLDTHALTVARAGTGTGTITGTGISCGADCSETFNYGSMVTLAATPATGSTFAGWSGACSGTGACTVTITVARSVTATFTLDTFTLLVAKAGTGAGTVTGTGISCGADCSEVFGYGTVVTLTQAATLGSTFAGWSGACSGTGACTVTIDAAKSVTATFTLDTFTLSVAKAGTGSGTVTGTGISCGIDCSETFPFNTMVTLSAAPATGSTFTGWSGACSGSGACSVTMDMARSATATFTLNTYALVVSKAGTGAGTVTGTGITCGADCSETFNHGTMVTLTATATFGSTFAGWSGACAGTGGCIVTMDMAKNVTATFTLNMYALVVSPAGTGIGTVTGTGITCGADCSETFSHGTMVALTATASTGSTFTGWSGACTGTGGCTVTMDMARNVTATFTLDTFTLQTATAGTGAGTITGPGINCNPDCSEVYGWGTPLTLIATPATGSTFTGWSGACTGTSPCMLTMTGGRNVTATFTLDTFTLTVSKIGSGAGTVTGTGITCGVDCTETVATGTSITLTATPSSAATTLSTFVGWSGACTGTGTCTVTLGADTNVAANFLLSPNIIFTTSGLYTGNLGGLSGADAICQSTAQAANLGGTYRAYLSSMQANTPINAPSRMGSASGWVRVDGVPVMNSITQFAVGQVFNAPRLTESGLDVNQTQFPYAWTGTNAGGTYDSACSQLQAFVPWGGPFGLAMGGIATSTSSTVVAGGTPDCSSMLRLYCLGIDRAAIAQ